MARSPAPAQDAVLRQLEAQNDLLRAMLGQLTLCTEALSLIRADQLRLMSQRGEAPEDAPHIHRCADPDHAHHPHAEEAPRVAGKAGRQGAPPRRGATRGKAAGGGRRGLNGGRHGG